MENKQLLEEFKEKWEKYSNLKILKPIEECNQERYTQAWEELKIYWDKFQLIKDVFSDQKNFTFSYYLQKPIKLDPYNKGFKEEWKKEYPDRIDEQDEEANEELDYLIGKVDTLSKYSSRGRCEEWFDEIPLTYSIDMKDRRRINFIFKGIEQGFDSYLHALGAKYNQILDAKLEAKISWAKNK